MKGRCFMCYKQEKQEKYAAKLQERFDELQVPFFLQDVFFNIASMQARCNYFATLKEMLAYDISSGANIAINDGQVFVNGENITVKNIPNVEVKIEGSINSLKTNGDVTVHGNVEEIKCGGDCYVYDDVNGNINAGGDIECEKIYGSVNAAGDIYYTCDQGENKYKTNIIDM